MYLFYDDYSKIINLKLLVKYNNYYCNIIYYDVYGYKIITKLHDFFSL